MFLDECNQLGQCVTAIVFYRSLHWLLLEVEEGWVPLDRYPRDTGGSGIDLCDDQILKRLNFLCQFLIDGGQSLTMMIMDLFFTNDRTKGHRIRSICHQLIHTHDK